MVRRIQFDELDSTNAEALRRAAAGERGPLWIDAARQSQGRGRSGRRWQSETGNLLASYLFTTTAPMTALPELSLVAGVAVYDAVSQCAPGGHDGLRLKWPNDLMMAGAKVGGVLIESSRAGTATSAVIGVGLNVSTAPALDDVATADVSAVIGQNSGLDTVRHTLAITLTQWLDAWHAGAGFGDVRAAWLKRGTPVGQVITVKVGNDVYDGTFAGLDIDGSLCLMRPDGEKQCYTFGDVSLLADG